MRRARSFTTSFLPVIVVFLGACGQILGLDEFTDAPPGDTGAGEGSSTTGTAGTSSCTDDAKNGDESDIDCGSSCPPCEDGRACSDESDCTSGVCVDHACKTPGCSDGVQNGAETGIDCGGGAASGCQKCGDGSGCEGDTDCAVGVCNGELCCTPEAVEATCAGRCESVANNCGQAVECAGCAAPMACGGGNPGEANVCGCTPSCPLWVKGFGDPNAQLPGTIAVDSSNNIVMTGLIAGTVDFGGGPLAGGFDYDVFVAKLDPDGNHLWSKRFGDSSTQQGNTVAVDSSGNVFILGIFRGTVNFGGATLTSAGQDDVFLAKLDSAGNHVWSRRFGDATSQFLSASIATDAAGDLLIAGNFTGTIDLGGAPLTSAGDRDIILAKIKEDGTHAWSKRFGDVDYDGAAGAVDASGNLLVGGTFRGSMNLGGGTLISAGLSDAFVAKFNNDGAYAWSKRFGDASEQGLGGVATDAEGDLIATGGFSGTIDLGGAPLTSAGSVDLLVAKFDSAGAHLWSERFGDAANQYGHSITTNASGNIVMTGIFDGTLDFGTTPLTTAGSWDPFVATLDSAGTIGWGRSFGNTEQQLGCVGAEDAQGNVIVAGLLDGPIDFGFGPISGAGSLDIFLAKYAP